MSDTSPPRVVILSVVVVAILATLLGRLWFLQVYDRASYVEQAASNRTRDVVTPAPRGEVYDSSGRALIQNRTAMVVKVNRSILRRQDDDGDAVLRRLVPVVDLTFEELAARTTPCGEKLPDGRKATSSEDGCWVGSPYQPIPVATFDARDTAALGKVLVVEENREDFPGITADFEAVREYPGGTLAAHTLGYLGPISEREVGTPGYEGVQDSSLVGRSGVEQTYEQQLRGKDGVEKLLVDKDGSVTGTASTTPPTAGDKLVLSLDAGVQAIAERELQAAILNARTRPYYADETKNLVADSGSVVVMEAKTGRIVALASYPSYDPALFTGGIDETTYTNLVAKANGEPLLFRATQGAYAPASTFKAITTAAVVTNGQSTFNTVSDCPATFAPLGDKRNFEGRSQGALSLRTAIVKSCDTNFYKFAYDEWVADGRLNPVATPKDPIINMALAFGLGQRTGIDLPGEITGTIPTRQWRKDIWTRNKGEYCKGAQNPAFDAQHRKDDQAYCDEGWKFQGGQAANFAIGQGETAVTPLQLASVYATVANGGQVVKPTVARGLLSADGRTVTEFAPTVKATVPVAPEVLAGLRDALHGVTTEPGGTGTNTFAGLPLSVAGKTGTGEVNNKQDTSWFASFAPADNPQLVVVGMVSQGGTGATTAAPLVRKVYEGIYGLNGQPAALPGGVLPATLPVVRGDGTVAPPGTPVTPPAATATAGVPAAPASLPSGSEGSVAGVAWDLPPRRTSAPGVR